MKNPRYLRALCALSLSALALAGCVQKTQEPVAGSGTGCRALIDPPGRRTHSCTRLATADNPRDLHTPTVKQARQTDTAG